MEANEVFVLRRKTWLLENTLVVGPDFESKLQNQGLLSSGDLAKLKDLPPTEKTRALLQKIETGGRSNFEKLCFCLDTQPKYAWVADELRAELKWQKGDLATEKYVAMETSFLLNSVHGVSILSDSVKEKLKSVLCGRYQVAKEAWRHQMFRHRYAVEDERQYYHKAIVKQCVELDKYIGVITELCNKGKIPKIELDKKDASSQGHRQEVALMQNKIDCILKAMDHVMYHYDVIRKERKACLEHLGEQDEGVELDKVVYETLNKASIEIGLFQTEVEGKDELSKNLSTQLYNLRMEMKRRRLVLDSDVERLEKQRLELYKRIEELQTQLEEVQKQKEFSDAKVVYWRERADSLAQARQLGYNYTKWLDKTRLGSGKKGLSYDLNGRRTSMNYNKSLDDNGTLTDSKGNVWVKRDSIVDSQAVASAKIDSAKRRLSKSESGGDP